MIQEWWGLTTHVADLTNRFAAEGFVALAPDLYGGRTTHDSAEAAALLEALPVDKAAQDLAGAVDFLLDHPAVTGDKVSATGLCMGGGFVLELAAQQGDRIAKAVPFYGIPRVRQDYSQLTAQVLGHYAATTHGSNTPTSRLKLSGSETNLASTLGTSTIQPGTRSSTTKTCLAHMILSKLKSPGRGPSSS